MSTRRDANEASTTRFESLDLAITGMTCAACSKRLEKVLNRLPGVEASVNLATERATLRFVAGAITTPAAIAAVERAGFGASELAKVEREAGRGRRAEDWRPEFRHFWIAALLSLPLVAQMPAMIGFWPGGEAQHDLIPRHWQWLLATPVQFWIGARFYRGAWAALRGGGANMDVLVALGTSMAWGFSAVVTVFALPQHVYFEGGAAVITLVLLGKLREARAKARAGEATPESTVQGRQAVTIRSTLLPPD